MLPPTVVAETVTINVAEFTQPAASVTVQVALYIPAVLYVTVGFSMLELDGDPPGKLHEHV